jgi:hypothetical protein
MRKWLIAAGAATVALAWFAPDDDVVPSAAATPRPAPVADAALPAQAMPQAPAIPAELQIQRRIEGEDVGNLFAGGAESPPAPLKPAAARSGQAEKTAAAQAATGDAAPPLVLLGSYRDGGQSTYLLQADGQDIVARIGDTVAGAYRLDAAHDGVLSFIYLPRNQSMTLALTQSTQINAPGEAN